MPNYRVTDTREIATMTPAGRRQVVYRVWIVTDRGAAGTVDVPAEHWNADDLPEILAKRAEELDLAFSVAEE